MLSEKSLSAALTNAFSGRIQQVRRTENQLFTQFMIQEAIDLFDECADQELWSEVSIKSLDQNEQQDLVSRDKTAAIFAADRCFQRLCQLDLSLIKFVWFSYPHYVGMAESRKDADQVWSANILRAFAWPKCVQLEFLLCAIWSSNQEKKVSPRTENSLPFLMALSHLEERKIFTEF